MFNHNVQDVSQKLFLMSQMSNKRVKTGTKGKDAINVITVCDTCDFDTTNLTIQNQNNKLNRSANFNEILSKLIN